MSASGNISNTEITESLYKFKRRYYLNQTIKGSIYAFLFLISSFLFVTVLEYYFYFNSAIRAIFLTSFVGVSIYTLYNFVIKHLIAYSNPDKYLSDEEAARLIGQHFPEINDKLLNTIQLNKITSQASSDLVWAGIKQKTFDVIKFPFFKAINLAENKKHLKYVYLPLAIVLILSFFIPQLFTQGTSRIINFNKKYEKPKPFTFQLENTNLTVFKNENLDLTLSTNGLDVEEVYLIKGGISIKMKKEKSGNHTYSLQNINSDDNFYFSAIGYDSETYSIKVVERPSINDVSISIEYPKYLNKKNICDMYYNRWNTWELSMSCK